MRYCTDTIYELFTFVRKSVHIFLAMFEIFLKRNFKVFAPQKNKNMYILKFQKPFISPDQANEIKHNDLKTCSFRDYPASQERCLQSPRKKKDLDQESR